MGLGQQASAHGVEPVPRGVDEPPNVRGGQPLHKLDLRELQRAVNALPREELRPVA